jgi:hypothetical protein
MPEYEDHYRFRDELIDRLRADVMGPVGGVDEVLDEDPATAYVVGVLYPQQEDGRRPVDDEQDFDESAGSDARDDMPDEGVPLANRVKPSAMGITFAVDLAVAEEVAVVVSAARYVAIDVQGEVIRPRRPERRADDEYGLRWRRSGMESPPIRFDVSRPGDHGRRIPGLAGAQLVVRCRERDADGMVSVTATLVNSARAERGDLLDASCIFQPQLVVRAPDAGAAFAHRRQSTAPGEEMLRSDMLYRHAPLFAVGHGCAAAWNWEAPARGAVGAGDGARTDEVRTSVVPVHELLLTDADPAIDVPTMRWLAEADRAMVVLRLRELVASYRSWIEGPLARERAQLVGGRFDSVADMHVEACDAAYHRMSAGIDLLADSTRPEIWEAFRLANLAMSRQRARTVWFRHGRDGEPDTSSPRWHAFQLGFVLLSLSGLVDSRHPDRDVADVLWFPTGGGKTEAYLGLVAFTTFLRRLRAAARGAPRTGGGVTVLMRYTLRLLTLQQFERAASLICAMELIRRSDPARLGPDVIALGMWVGKAATPNTLESAATSLLKLASGVNVEAENPVQLRSCPWCGTKMDHTAYRVMEEIRRLEISCPDMGCDFHGGLPVHVVDETIYDARPTLLIATADKFAQVTWRDQVAALFNRSRSPEGTGLPELVIQDELHLISGPLGSLAGVYETAVDLAAGRPKVIASTATIRRADEQGRALFDRTVQQFPPSGLDSRYSWFAVERPRTEKATRTYLGLLTSSTSQATLLIRTYAALLHYAKHIEGSDAVRDAYWTLVGYFNSLRLLSAAELQVHSDVDERLRQLARRDDVPARVVDQLSELTSRKESSKIPQYLEELFVEYGMPGVVDVLLATNMISVGVDVDRLGLMAVMGQPQTTAEYIQATSRVGRQDPGLVVVLLNSARSRDRSHYESFTGYHSALYRQVESTSVTPWAPRSRDRALHAALVGLLRLMHASARPNEAAANVDDFGPWLTEITDQIVDRVGRASSRADAEITRQELERFIEGWSELARNNALVYEAPRRTWAGQHRRSNAALLSAYGQDDDLTESAPTMWSLRDVDVECPLYLER